MSENSSSPTRFTGRRNNLRQRVRELESELEEAIKTGLDRSKEVEELEKSVAALSEKLLEANLDKDQEIDELKGEIRLVNQAFAKMAQRCDKSETDLLEAKRVLEVYRRDEMRNFVDSLEQYITHEKLVKSELHLSKDLLTEMVASLDALQFIHDPLRASKETREQSPPVVKTTSKKTTDPMNPCNT